jgi:hypothetical protein
MRLLMSHQKSPSLVPPLLLRNVDGAGSNAGAPKSLVRPSPTLLEALTVLAPKGAPLPSEGRSEIERIRVARICYGHLARRLGVAITEAMRRREFLKVGARDFRVTSAGVSFLNELGVDVEKAKRRRRALAWRCLDWTERQSHARSTQPR